MMKFLLSSQSLLNCDMTKPMKWFLCPAKTDQSASDQFDQSLLSTLGTGTQSMIAVCNGYRIKLCRINLIRDMVMQLNFTHLPKTEQHSKHMLASQTSWL